MRTVFLAGVRIDCNYVRRCEEALVKITKILKKTRLAFLNE